MHKGDPEIINYCCIRLAENLGRSSCAYPSLSRPASVCTSGTGEPSEQLSHFLLHGHGEPGHGEQ